MLSAEFIKLFNELVESYSLSGQGSFMTSKDKSYDKIIQWLSELKTDTIDKNRENFDDYHLLFLLETSAVMYAPSAPLFIIELAKFLHSYDKLKPNVLCFFGETLNIKVLPIQTQLNLSINQFLTERVKEKEVHISEIRLITDQIKKLEDDNKQLMEEIRRLQVVETRAYEIEIKFNKLKQAQALMKEMHGLLETTPITTTPVGIPIPPDSISKNTPPPVPTSQAPTAIKIAAIVPEPPVTTLPPSQVTTHSNFFSMNELMDRQKEMMESLEEKRKNGTDPTAKFEAKKKPQPTPQT